MIVVIYTARELNEIDRQVKFLLDLPPAHVEEQAAGLVTLAVKHLPRLVAQVRELLADDTLNSTFRRILLIKKARDRKQKARRKSKRYGNVIRYNLSTELVEDSFTSPDIPSPVALIERAEDNMRSAMRKDWEPYLYNTEGKKG